MLMKKSLIFFIIAVDDFSRVVLSSIPGITKSDYINASKIDVSIGYQYLFAEIFSVISVKV